MGLVSIARLSHLCAQRDCLLQASSFGRRCRRNDSGDERRNCLKLCEGRDLPSYLFSNVDSLISSPPKITCNNPQNLIAVLRTTKHTNWRIAHLGTALLFCKVLELKSSYLKGGIGWNKSHGLYILMDTCTRLESRVRKQSSKKFDQKPATGKTQKGGSQRTLDLKIVMISKTVRGSIGRGLNKLRPLGYSARLNCDEVRLSIKRTQWEK